MHQVPDRSCEHLRGLKLLPRQMSNKAGSEEQDAEEMHDCALAFAAGGDGGAAMLAVMLRLP